MKLIYCLRCKDVIALHGKKRYCLCKKSWGQYGADKVNAEIGGYAVPLGITNNSFELAVHNRPDTGMGIGFKAFVIPRNCPTVNDPRKLSTVEYMCERLMGTVPP